MPRGLCSGASFMPCVRGDHPAPAATQPDREKTTPANISAEVVKFFLWSKFCLAVKISAWSKFYYLVEIFFHGSDCVTSSTMMSAYFSSSSAGVGGASSIWPGLRVTSCLSV